MRVLRRALLRLLTVFRSGRAEADLAREIHAHLALLEDRFVAQGMTADEAHRAAKRAFGGVEQVKEHQRHARSFRWLSGWGLDLRLGARMLIKYPGITLVGGVAIAFGISVGAATFEFLTQVLHPSLPLDEGHRIVGLRAWNAETKAEEPRVLHDFARWRAELLSIEDLGAFRTTERNLAVGNGYGEPVEVAEITASAFRLARVVPVFGRSLVEADEGAGAAPVVVIGYAVWQKHFGGDAGVIGRTVRLGTGHAAVIGVMPEGFAFPVSHSLWAPLRAAAAQHAPLEGPAVRLVGRLARGVTLDEAQAELRTHGQRASVDLPGSHAHLRPEVLPYASTILDVSEIALGIRAFNVVVIMFVLLVCVNVATLVFARAVTRQNEIVVRNALGASRARIVMQLFTEALVLGGLAAVVGLAFAGLALRWWMDVFAAEAGGRLPFWLHGRLSATTVLYVGALTVLGALVAGALPALKVTGRGLEGRLRQMGVGGTEHRFGGVWTVVIVVQVAATVAFPATAFFVQRSVSQIQRLDVGFASGRFLSARLESDPSVNAALSRTDGAARLRATYEELERRLAREPGVANVTFTDRLPRTLHPRQRVQVDQAATAADPAAQQVVTSASVALNFFDAVGTPILSGRGFRTGDPDSTPRVVVVNQSFVERVLGGRNPIGRRVRYVPRISDDGVTVEQPAAQWFEIVGVVRDLGMVTGETGQGAGLYHPVTPGTAYPVHIAVEVGGDPAAFAPRLREVAAAVDPALRLHDVLPLDKVGSKLWMEFAFLFQLLVLVSAIALLLSLAGIYSVLSLTVSQRTREIGVRIALGAAPRRIIATIFSRALAQAGVGVAGGGVLVFALTHQVVGLSVLEILMVLAYLVLMLAVCSLACVVPTRRALRIEPTEALRANT